MSEILKSEYSSVRILNLTKCNLNDKSMYHFGDSMKVCASIETLIFDKNNLFGKKFFNISIIFIRNPYLKKLSLGECNIKDDGAECIA